MTDKKQIGNCSICGEKSELYNAECGECGGFVGRQKTQPPQEPSREKWEEENDEKR